MIMLKFKLEIVLLVKERVIFFVDSLVGLFEKLKKNKEVVK